MPGFLGECTSHTSDGTSGGYVHIGLFCLESDDVVSSCVRLLPS